MSGHSKSLKISGIYGISSQDESSFVVVGNLVAYVAGAGVVVSSIQDNKIMGQRFFCANSGQSSVQSSSAYSYLNMIPRFNNSVDSVRRIDSYGFNIVEDPEMVYGANSLQTSEAAILVMDDSNVAGSNGGVGLLSPSKLANKIRTISCIAISPDMRLLAVGESGYQPRVLLYSLAPESNGRPVYIISDHQFGINKLKFSPDSRKLASLGYINDGYLNIWGIDNKNKISLIGANKCSSVVNQMVWETNVFLTAGTRHLKIWFVDELDDQEDEDMRKRLAPLRGKNVVLNGFLNSNFIDSSSINANEILVLSDQGDIGLLELTDEYPLNKVYELNSNVNKLLVCDDMLWFADSGIHKIDLNLVLASSEEQKILKRPMSPNKIRKKPIMALNKLANKELIYLTEHEEIFIYNCDTGSTKLLINSLTKKLAGFKKCFNGDLIIWGKTGEIKKVENNEVKLFFEIGLQTNELISNELSAVEMNCDNEIFAGDKFGNLSIYRDFKLVDAIKAHESSITGIVFFEIGNEKFVVSVSRDRMIQVFIKKGIEWDLYQTLSLHKGTLIGVLYYQGRLFVCSSDRTVSIHKFEATATSDDLADEFNDKLQLEENQRVKIYQEKIISSKSTPITMQIFNDELILSTQDKLLTIYKISDNVVDKIRSLKLYNELNDSLLVENFTICDKLIFTSCNDKSLRCFNYQNGKQISSNWGHSELIAGLIQIDKDNLISVGNDGCMFKWEHKQEHEPSLEMEIPEIQPRVARKIAPTAPLSPTRQKTPRSSPSIRSLSPTTRLQKTTPQIPIHTPSKSRRNSLTGQQQQQQQASPTTLRLSTLNRLSRSPLKDKTNVEILQKLRQKIVEKNIAEQELQLIKKEVGNIWRLLNEEEEIEILERYSDKLLQIFEQKMS